MEEGNIQLILQYCSFNIKFFFVNKSFERIYIQVARELGSYDSIFGIACYEKNNNVIDTLKNNYLIKYNKEQKKIHKFWINDEHNLVNLFYVNCDKLKNNSFSNLFELVIHDRPHYWNKEIKNKGARKYGLMFLNIFYKLKDKFVNQDNLLIWTYKEYEVRYNNKCLLLFDYKLNNFLILGAQENTKTFDIVCNKFYFHDNRFYYEHLQEKEENSIQELIEEAFQDYDFYI